LHPGVSLYYKLQSKKHFPKKKGETVVIFWIEVPDACHNAELVVFATLFGANNVKAL